MEDFTLIGSSGKVYRIFAQEINWEFDPSADAMDETQNVVLILLSKEDGIMKPVDIKFHPGPIKHYFSGRAQLDHIVSLTGAMHYATLWRNTEEEMRAIAADLHKAYKTRSR